MTIFLRKKLQQNFIKWVFVVAALLYAGLLPRFDIGSYNDDAAFVLAAKSLANGHYQFLYMPGQPSADFPFPGLPALLAPLIRFIEPQWHYLELGSLAATLFSAIFFFYLIRRWLPTNWTIVALCIYVFNPTVVHLSGIVLAAPYFLAAIMGSFLLLAQLIERPSRWRAWALGLLTGWAALSRPEGIVLLVGVSGALIYARQGYALGRVLCAALPLWTCFLLRSVDHRGALNVEYASDLNALAHYWSTHRWEFVERFGIVAEGFFDRTLLSLPAKMHALSSVSVVVVASGLSIISLGIFSLAKTEPQRRPVLLGLCVFLLAYFVTFVFWPIPLMRYLVILVPFALLFLLQGLRVLCSTGFQRRWTLALGGLLLVSTYGYDDCYGLYQSWISHPTDLLAPSAGINWLKVHTLKTDVMLSPIALSLYLYGERQGFGLLFAQNEEEFRFLLASRHIAYIVDRPVNPVVVHVPGAPDPNRQWRQIRRWVALNPEYYKLVFHDEIEKISVYRIPDRPNFVRAYELYRAALKSFSSGNTAEGYRQIRQSHRNDSTIASAYNAEGATHLRAGELKEAEKALLLAVNRRPGYETALLNLARLYRAKRNFSLEQKYLQISIDASAADDTIDNFSAQLTKLEGEGDLDLSRVSIPHQEKYDVEEGFDSVSD